MKSLVSLISITVICAAPAFASFCIAGEDFDGGASNLISSSVTNQDGGPGDWFGVGSRNAWPQGFPSPGVPFGLGDDSVVDYSGGGVSAGDTEGIYGQFSNWDNHFFSMSDSDEFGAAQTASWVFDISGYSGLQLKIGIAGISNDSFDGYALGSFINFDVQIDGNPVQTALRADAVDNPGFATRLMDAGTASGGGRLLEVTGDNPVTKFLAGGGIAADTFTDKSDPLSGLIDIFQTGIDGTGSTLTLVLTADMPFEAAAFDNICITGVPEPASALLLAVGTLLLIRRR